LGASSARINPIVKATRMGYKAAMTPLMFKRILAGAAGVGLLLTAAQALAQAPATASVLMEPDAHGWYQLFDGKTLSGWTAPTPGHWEVKDGVVAGTGPTTHLLSPLTYHNLEFRATVRLNHSGNSGMYIRAAYGPGWPKGYEAQVENTSPDTQRTGSLYNFHPVREQLIADDTWWTQTVVAVGNRIIIKVNDKIVTDYVDAKNTYTTGHLALQQHNDGSVVEFKDLMVKPLPADEAAALAEARKDVPDIK